MGHQVTCVRFLKSQDINWLTFGITHTELRTATPTADLWQNANHIIRSIDGRNPPIVT